jgi:hypothetical protein
MIKQNKKNNKHKDHQKKAVNIVDHDGDDSKPVSKDKDQQKKQD